VGSRYADTIIGNEFDNAIIGGRGHDVITGGDGADAMTGGPGRDHFVYRIFTEMGRPEHPDVILDLEPNDRIDLRGLHATYRGTGTDDALLHADAKPGQFYADMVRGELRFDADGDGAVDAVIRVHVTGVEQFMS
jgi:Ca2+-binding RTX toxin-like protein